MRYLSVCSGIEAASVAWHHLGWEPAAFSEIDPFPSAVLAHRFPGVPNLGDMTKHQEWNVGPIDLLVGGTPCQSFSVAGLRRGLHDPRGGLMLTYLEIARSLRPRWIVWENVPGVLSSGGGRDFGAFLGALGELGYGWAYRVLDAQWCRTHGHPRAVPQRRRRVFVVGCIGDWSGPAEVLFERESVQRDPASSRKARKDAASDAQDRARAGGWPAEVACTMNTKYADKLGLEDQHALSGASMFVPSVVGSLTAKGPEGLGAPEVDAHHYVVGTQTAYGGSDPECSDTVTSKWAKGSGGPSGSECGLFVAHGTFRGGNIGEYVEDSVGGTLRANGVDYVGGESLVAWPAEVAATLSRCSPNCGGPGASNQEIFSQRGANLVPAVYRKSKRAQTETDDETWVDDGIANTLNGFDTGDTRTTHAVAFTQNQREEVRELGPVTGALSGQGTHQTTYVAHAFYSTGGTHGLENTPERSPPLKVDSGLGIPSPPAVAFTCSEQSNGFAWERPIFPTITAQVPSDTSNLQTGIRAGMVVRRLTPVECERLQGFPDGWTDVPYRGRPAADGPRYKALGNSMAVNCMAWIGERIAAYESRNKPG